ncbi:glycosyltransferase [Psychrobium sp. 1_MG-2023]|uniref:glycosyltransferase n=1 Tax=Psychrobium sp. 1_MG-2023 TaxID=3062624 RepID=UPI000C3375C9|nr:glycosyltransferase [Psychrobium sp. 1_MG-2023]MDP2562090.1 glycosyltransferase [Psychrobium sp. 1_MG-2023]PKF55689.1 glycosyl transferase family 1 [Alteromonadales bacterium alter-6D02]
MKVLQVGKFYHPVSGGVESVTFDITELLNQKDIVCDVLCTDDGNNTRTDIINGYKVFRAGACFHVQSTSLSIDYIKLLRQHILNYDILHVHLPNPLATIALLFAKLEGKKIVLHWHSDIIKQKKLLTLYKPFETWMLKRADAIIGTSPVYVDCSEALSPVRAKCVDIPIGIDDGLLEADLTKVQEIKHRYSEKKIIFSLGRLVYYKGFEYLISAAKELSDEYVIVIGGTGPLEAKLKQQIISLGLQERVYLTGRIENEDLGSYFEACSLFCLPSIMKSEAFGVVQLEAMSFSKPIIATNIEGSGTSWVNEQGTSGLNVRVKDPQALAQAIENVLGDDEQYEFFCRQARERFEQSFRRETMVDKIISLYGKI